MNGSFRPAADWLAQLQRLQRHFDSAFRALDDGDIRSTPTDAFPTLNVGRTADTLEVMALVPGVDAGKLELSVDKGLLIISGERRTDLPRGKDGTAVYAQERFDGGFRRVLSLPDDIDPARIDATCRDGVLRVTLAKRESSKPRRIAIA